MTFLPVKQLGLAAVERHDAVRRPVPRLQFLSDRRGGDADRAVVSSSASSSGRRSWARSARGRHAIAASIADCSAREGLIVAAIGAAVGVAAGVGYAWLMITGLADLVGRGDLDAVSRAARHADGAWCIGWLVGVVVSWLTIRWSIRRLARLPVGRLLAGCDGAADEASCRTKAAIAAGRRIRAALVAARRSALCVVGFLLQRRDRRPAIFFGSGAAVLALLLGRSSLSTCVRSGGRKPSQRSFSLPKLSALNTARNPGRSTLTIGLVAAASFLIVGDQRVSTRHGRGGHRRLRLRRHERSADSLRPQHAGGPAGAGLFRRRTASSLADWRHVFAARRGRRGCQLFESVSADAAARAGRARRIHRARRLRLGGRERRIRIEQAEQSLDVLLTAEPGSTTTSGPADRAGRARREHGDLQFAFEGRRLAA